MFSGDKFFYRKFEMNLKPSFPDSVDVLILGGGVHGVGVLHDLVSRGLKKVCLIEKNSLASGTSSKSTKLIHGGLRYLERLSQMSMVFESLQERKFLLSVAPDIVHPIEILIPLLQSDLYNRAKIKVGLGLYDYLAKNSLIKKHTNLNQETVQKKVPILKAEYLKKVYSYWDAQTDDKVLVQRIARSAIEFGGELFEQTKVLTIEDKKDFWQLVVVSKGVKRIIQAQYVINCMGPWTNEFFAKNHLEQTHKGVNNKGVHLLVRDLGLTSGLLLTSKTDKRKFFVLPWNGKTLIGTTEKEYHGSLDQVTATPEEVMYLLDSCNEYFKIPLTLDDVESSFAGLRWLAVEEDQSISSTSRESILGVTENKKGFLLTIYGGKLTSYRLLSEKIGDKVVEHKGVDFKSQTKEKRFWISG